MLEVLIFLVIALIPIKMPGFVEEEETRLNDGTLGTWILLLLQAAFFSGLEKFTAFLFFFFFLRGGRGGAAAVPFPEM